jgi:hypothetical protein
MRALVEPLGLTMPMAAFNGAVIALPDLSILDERQLPGYLVPALIDPSGASSPTLIHLLFVILCSSRSVAQSWFATSLGMESWISVRAVVLLDTSCRRRPAGDVDFARFETYDARLES